MNVGDRAPAFRLPSAQGSDVALDDFRGRRSVVVWFTKGMACPFCRQKMSQLARSYPRLAELGGEVLQVTTSTPERARFYARQFSLPFPYLCDADYAVRRQWGMDVRSHSLPWYAKTLLKGLSTPQPENDFGKFKPSPGEIPKLLTDDDMGLFIVDRHGVVRYALTGSYFTERGPRAIPDGEEIARELERCATAA